jgi:1-acyl-sn-glycerol-3-phosphate acyltransferase
MIRAIVSNIALYINMIAWMLVCWPIFFLPRTWGLKVVKAWALSCIWITRITAGIKWEIKGAENIPTQGCIVASKHQSAWETLALVSMLPDPAFILKRELMWIPVFGWYVAKFRMIPVNRGSRSKALKAMTLVAKQEMEKGRQVIIFPEGTRKAVDAEPAYKWGVAHMYSQCDVPCVPVALNSGYFWPRRKMRRYPGTITVEWLPAIQPGMKSEQFFQNLETTIESTVKKIIRCKNH